MSAAHVRLVVHLNRAARIVEAGAHDPPGAVVLEAPREDTLAAGGERRGDRVPLEATWSAPSQMNEIGLARSMTSPGR